MAEDGSFEIAPGKSVTSPFTSVACPSEGTTKQYAAAEAFGARRVRVYVSQLEEPMYGILALCPIPPGTTGPVSRSYQIQIPQEYIDATTDGRASIVYESLPQCSNTKCFGDMMARRGTSYVLASNAAYASGDNGFGWMLWLSRVPFPKNSQPRYGIGVRISDKGFRGCWSAIVEEVFPNTPAHFAGVKAGWAISYVTDDRNKLKKLRMDNTEEARQDLRGQEGSKVTVHFKNRYDASGCVGLIKGTFVRVPTGNE